MFFRRIPVSQLRSPVSRDKVRLVLGARQTGKTRLLRAIHPDDATVVFDLLDARLRLRFERDPSQLSREVAALPRRIRNVVVDEVQKVPALLDEIQALHDRDPAAHQIFLTGSSARRLRSGAGNLLPGRSHVYRLEPVTRWEMGAASKVPELSPPTEPATDTTPPFPSPELDRLLRFGSLPGVMLEAPPTAAATLVAYVEIYLEEEIRREAIVRDLGRFADFLHLCAIESGRIVNLAKLSRETGIAESTLKSYYAVLEDTFVGERMGVYGRSGRKRVLTTPRFYLFDGGVRTAAAGWAFDAVTDDEGGDLFEHWVGTELLHRARYLGRGVAVRFWRTVSGAEVDFVWQTRHEDLPIEVKWTRNPTPHDARHVEAFIETYPRRAKRGLVVCRCERAQRLTEHVTAIPWSEL